MLEYIWSLGMLSGQRQSRRAKDDGLGGRRMARMSSHAHHHEGETVRPACRRAAEKHGRWRKTTHGDAEQADGERRGCDQF